MISSVVKSGECYIILNMSYYILFYFIILYFILLYYIILNICSLFPGDLKR